MNRSFWNALAVTSGAGFITGLVADHRTLRRIAKPLPALALAARTLHCAGGNSTYRRCVAAGLVACAAGDLGLEWSEDTFPQGVAAFLVGHVLFVGAFATDTDAPFKPGYALAAASLGAGVILSIWQKLPAELRPGIAVYAAAISTMLWRSMARIADGRATSDRRSAAVGAGLFVFSDALIGFTRFAGAQPLPVRFAIILTYWMGLLGIANSAESE